MSEVHTAGISDVDSVMLGTVSNTRDKTKNSFLYFFSELKNLPSFLNYLQTSIYLEVLRLRKIGHLTFRFSLGFSKFRCKTHRKPRLKNNGKVEEHEIWKILEYSSAVGFT